MESVKLGSTDIEISKLGLGCWQFSQGRGMAGKFWVNVAQDTATEIVEHALSAGINWFDTAEAYGNGRSEQVLATALHRLDKQVGDVVVATKWSPTLRFAGSIRKTIDVRLRKLDGYPIDLYQVHHPLSLSSPRAQMMAMADIVEAGKVRSVGISNFRTRQMKSCHGWLQERGLALASNQVRYSLLDRRIERSGMIDAARSLGITIIAYSPLEQGLLTGKIHAQPDAIRGRPGPRKHQASFKEAGLERTRPLVETLRRIGEKHDATPAQVALNWTVNFHGDTVVAIPGVTRAEQARDNAAGLKFSLSSQELREIDEASRPVARGYA